MPINFEITINEHPIEINKEGNLEFPGVEKWDPSDLSAEVWKQIAAQVDDKFRTKIAIMSIVEQAQLRTIDDMAASFNSFQRVMASVTAILSGKLDPNDLEKKVDTGSRKDEDTTTAL